jgi:aminoglycoside phosphotransferase (APT) family kinase protein
VGLGKDVRGTAFYVMDAVPGVVVRDGDEAADVLSAQARAQSGRELMAGLAALHAVDADEVGLGRLGRGSDYLSRQVASWQGQAEHHRVAAFPEADQVRERLLEDLPGQSEITLVHGDYKLDNVILTPDGELAAVLDWELATRGDPLVDLAVCVYYWTEFSDPVQPFDRPPSLLPGMASRDDLLAYYEQLTGRHLVRRDYYFAYAAWRLAMVLEGVAGRARAGAYGPLDHEEDARLGAVVRKLVGHATAYLDMDRHGVGG